MTRSLPVLQNIAILRWFSVLVLGVMFFRVVMSESFVRTVSADYRPAYRIPCQVSSSGNWGIIRNSKRISSDQALIDDINNNGRFAHGWPAIDLSNNTANIGPRNYGICDSRTILLARGGRVIAKNWDSCEGWRVKIDHGDGQYSLYLHLASQTNLALGVTYQEGVEVGTMGQPASTTCGSGIHLHFGVINQGGSTSIGPIENWYFKNPFLSGKMDFNGDGKPDIFAILKNGGASGRVEAHIMNGADNYQSFLAQIATAQNQGDLQANWVFTTGDYNGDGRPDLYLVAMSNTSSGKVEVSILNGADSYQSFLGRIVLPQSQSGPTDVWSFATGDYNGDGKTDLYLIAMTGTASGRVEAHIFNGADSYQSTLTRVATAQNPTGPDDVWSFAIGDYNGDGRPDIYLITFYKTGTGKVEAHILSGADGYQSFLGHIPTAQNQKSPNDIWSFVVDDYNGDGKPDIYLINKSNTGTGKVEAHIMDGSNNYQGFFGHIPTTLGQVAPNCSWDFLGGRCVSGPAIGWIDSPRPNSAISGVSPVIGWARAENSTISRIEVLVDGVKSTDSAYALLPSDAAGNVGWQWYWDTKSIVNGPHSIVVKAVAATGKESILLNSGDQRPSTTIDVQNRYFFADVTGDGLADAIDVRTTGVYVTASGTRYAQPALWTERPFYGQRGTFFADVDGDRKADLIVVNNNFITVRISTGTSFAYEKGWTADPYYGSVGTYFADVNGDGRADAIAVSDTLLNNRVNVRFSTGSSFAAGQDWTLNPYYGSRGTFFADVNNDRRADAIAVNDITLTNRVVVRPSTGSSFADNQDWTQDQYIGALGSFFADVNGDGRADAIVVNDASLNNRISVRLSTGSVFASKQDWTTDTFYGDQGVSFADVNGDGRADAIIVLNTTSSGGPRFAVRLSTGSGFSSPVDWWQPPPTLVQ